jgi:hypothetical protein
MIGERLLWVDSVEIVDEQRGIAIAIAIARTFPQSFPRNTVVRGTSVFSSVLVTRYLVSPRSTWLTA